MRGIFSFVGVLLAQPAICDLIPLADAVRVSSCIQSQMRDETSRRPRIAELGEGVNYQCRTLSFFKDGSGQGTVALITDLTESSYRFTKDGWGVINQAGTARASRSGSVQYLPFQDLPFDGYLGLPYGFHNGFLWDYLRMSSSGALLSEESIIYSDVDHSPMSREAPVALASDWNRVFRVSMCFPVAQFAEKIAQMPCWSAFGHE